MWTENEVLTARVDGTVRAMTSTPRPAKKARRARGRDATARAASRRPSATRYAEGGGRDTERDGISRR